MENNKFITLTYFDDTKTYIKADAIIEMYEEKGRTCLFTINGDVTRYIKESPNEILAKIGVEIEERKAGEWENTNDPEEWFGDQFKCSVCGWVTLENGSYCPHCGAEMENGEKND